MGNILPNISQSFGGLINLSYSYLSEPTECAGNGGSYSGFLIGGKTNTQQLDERINHPWFQEEAYYEPAQSYKPGEVPMSCRGLNHEYGDLLSKLGYENLEELLNSIPRGGVIIDVGCGGSDFCYQIATVRPDVTTINFDINLPPSPEEVDLWSAPPNLLFIQGDMRWIDDILTHDKFDWVFSNWALPYLVHNERAEVLLRFFNITKPGGRISFGPKSDDRKIMTFIKGEDVDESKVWSWATEYSQKIQMVPNYSALVPLEFPIRTDVIQYPSNESTISSSHQIQTDWRSADGDFWTRGRTRER